MIYRTFPQKQDIFEAIMLKLIVSTIPVLGFIYALNNHALWKWLLIYLPIGIIGYYIVGAKGVLLDIENERYKIFKSLFFWDIGAWKKLPHIDRIVLKSTNEFVNTTARRGRSWSQTGYRVMKYKIALINSRKDFILVILNTKDENEANKIAESLSRNLQLELEKLK